MKEVSLRDIVDTKTGYSIRGMAQPVSQEEGDFKLLQMKNIDPYLGVRGRLSYIKLQGKKPPEFLKQGDIVFIGRGANFFSICLNEDLEETTAAPQLLVLKLKNNKAKEVLPQYISWFINSKFTRSYFHKETIKTSVAHISMRSLEKLKIQLPTLEKQKIIVKMHNLSLKEKRVTEQIIKKRIQLIDQVLMKAF